MNNEIKVGDKVRVSKDAPIHIIGSASEIECKAVALGTDADIAVIGFRTQEKQRYDAYRVPTKYLTKVEDEAKEPKFKVGDRVIVANADNSEYKGLVSIVEGIVNRNAIILNCNGYLIPFRESDLEPYTEPTEETSPNVNHSDIDIDTIVARGYIPDPNTFFCNRHNFDWDTYTSDLAHDLALKVANKYNDPTEAADYAVSVAKAVVENLKKK